VTAATLLHHLQGHDQAKAANARWSLDFVHDQLACGRRFRILNVVDDITRECLAAIPDTSISGRLVARELTTLIERRGKPGMIVSDNGTELNSNAILSWSKDHKVEWHDTALGRPMQNGYVESFNESKQSQFGKALNQWGLSLKTEAMWSWNGIGRLSTCRSRLRSYSFVFPPTPTQK